MNQARGFPTMREMSEAIERARQAEGAELRELLYAADALMALHGAEAGAVSTSTVAEAVERLEAACTAMRREAS